MFCLPFCNSIYVRGPLQVCLDGYSQILDVELFWAFEYVAMEFVLKVMDFLPIWYCQNMAFSRMEFHEPVYFPFSNSSDVLLQLLTILIGSYFSLENAVVCKESYDTVLGPSREIIDVDQEEDRAQHSALGNT